MLQSDREYVLPSVSHNTMFYHKQKLYTQLKEPSSLIYKLKDNAIIKGISQNLDNGSKNSENQKKDGVRPKIVQNYQIMSLL